MGCRQRHDPKAMIRFVRDTQGALQIDVRQKHPGRGAYLHVSLACLERACRKRAFQQVLGATFDPDKTGQLFADMKSAAQQRFRERMSLARRAGGVVTGVEMVRRAMADNQVRLVCLALDASPSTSRQISQNAERKGLPVARCTTGSELAQAVGLDFVSVVAITKEPFASDLEILCTPLKEWSESSQRYQ